MSFPFSETNIIENISTQISNLFDMDSTKFESEIIKIKSVIFLKARGSETNFWNLLSEEKYPEFRSTLSDDHLEQCLRLAVSNYSPDYYQLVNDMQCHTSTMARSTK
ncbi:unnamed protein product [Macrosiphum euphorbiae]|uniref:Uncharacterized protein n=1 Tax=Macrosiphum euphorbiae TaxID=13131 RepID=A0AAV0VN50_9HEMI|nr:unnamed protein product [Macrosiphum euphorbiae]